MGVKLGHSHQKARTYVDGVENEMMRISGPKRE
jgi:hypothetical protein